MRKTIFVAVLLAGVAATPAMAQENAPFTGARVEGLIGYDNVNISGVKNPDGLTYGVGVGYDFQFGGALVGIEGDADNSNAKTCFRDVSTPGDRLCLKAGRDLYVGGRVGTVVGGKALLYFKAGYTNARAGQSYNSNAAGGSFSTHTTLDGVRAGLGAEYALSHNTFIKAEYRYSNYEKGIERNEGVAGFGLRF